MIDRIPLYDCSIGYEMRDQLWSSPWKEWCCSKKEIGCKSQAEEAEEERKAKMGSTFQNIKDMMGEKAESLKESVQEQLDTAKKAAEDRQTARKEKMQEKIQEAGVKLQ